MSGINTAARALYGAYRLARLDPNGLSYFDISPTGFWHSFTAAILVFPLYLATMLARWVAQAEPTNGIRFIAIEMIAYVIAWTAFPVLMTVVVKAVDREQYYMRGIIAYNWAAVLQNVLYLPVVILGLVGVRGIEPLSLAVLIFVLFYSWFVTKTALQVSIFAAWGIVALDLVVSILLSFWSEVLIAA